MPKENPTKLTILKRFISNPKKVGAIAPSSKALAQALDDAVDLKQYSTIIELGPGTGSFTRKIVKEKNPDALFFMIEADKKMADMMKKTFPEYETYLDYASNLRTYLNKHDLKKCDLVVSGLPFALFDQELQLETLDAVVDALDEGGQFLTFTYRHSKMLGPARKFQKNLESRFSEVKTTTTVWNNLPPAFWYHCKL